MLSLHRDCVILILNYLSLNDARTFGLTCQTLFEIYRSYLSRRADLKHFRDTLIKIQQREAERLTYEYGEYANSVTYKKLRKRYSIKIPNPNIGNRPWRFPGEKDTIRQWLEIPEEESKLAYSEYLTKLDEIIQKAQNDSDRYNELPLPTFVKYLINIWLKYPSKVIRMVPVDVLKQYLEDGAELGADYCLLFKTVQTPCSGPDISDEKNIWNIKDKIVDLDEVIIACSRTLENSFLFGEFDIEYQAYPPLTICHDCLNSLPCPLKCKYYFIDYENRFPYSAIDKGKLENCKPNGYYEGTFLEIWDYFVKNRYLLKHISFINNGNDSIEQFLLKFDESTQSSELCFLITDQLYDSEMELEHLIEFFEIISQSLISPNEFVQIFEKSKLSLDSFIEIFNSSGLKFEHFIQTF